MGVDVGVDVGVQKQTVERQSKDICLRNVNLRYYTPTNVIPCVILRSLRSLRL